MASILTTGAAVVIGFPQEDGAQVPLGVAAFAPFLLVLMVFAIYSSAPDMPVLSNKVLRIVSGGTSVTMQLCVFLSSVPVLFLFLAMCIRNPPGFDADGLLAIGTTLLWTGLTAVNLRNLLRTRRYGA